MASSEPSSSSSVPAGGWTHDVFLSFRGEDTRNNFVDHLKAALVRHGIQTFKDDEDLRRGKQISPQLVKGIEESRVAVVVFSKNYANSRWCLEELAKIMECQDRKVLPVFYHVDPSDVRGQKNEFATAFEQQENKFREEMDKVNKWRKALTAAANLSGHHISDVSGGEYAIIDKIVQDILDNIQPRGKENKLVGIESQMDTLNSLLRLEATKEVLIIGIHGMGGIGKTTIAWALFRRIANTFEGSSFIKDVRENSEKDICTLQENILKDILATNHGFNIRDPDYGAELIQERLCNKKVLLVLDDVNHVKQLEFLAETREWFGPGSRIIITTRDEYLLSDANSKYKPPFLNEDQAVELFSKHAFRKNTPPKEYEKLSNRAIQYTGGLPLALKVLGSFLCGKKDTSVWKSALDRLAETPNKEIFDILKLSYDGLEDSEKKIFLDIACFFKDVDIDRVTRVLDSSGFYAGIGITSLIGKSLITVSKRLIGMHDLIQEMGWQIVRESAPNSRLWKLEQFHVVTKKNRELEAVEAIVLRWEYRIGDFSADVFESMKNLRLLVVRGHFTCSEPTFLPDKLRWLCWYSCPFSSLPVADMRELVGLEITGPQIEHLWKGKKIMPNLKFIELKCLDRLKKFPDVSGAPNIERLILSHCTNLVKIDESLGFLKRLVHLDMSNCKNLKHLPSRFEMESLETLILSRCDSLKGLPEFSPCMLKLSHISLERCRSLQNISSICHLSSLKRLDLNNCYQLQNLIGLPSGIQVLKAKGCTSLKKIEDLTKNYECLYMIDLRGCKKLLQDEENAKYLESMLGQSFLKKWAAVDGCLSIAIPGSKIPRWFEEQQLGSRIALKLPPNWKTRIMGFAICGVFRDLISLLAPNIELTFENDGMFVPETEVDSIIASSTVAEVAEEGNWDVWINYVPFSLFQGKASHIIPRNLVVGVSNVFQEARRCGVHVVYKEDVESTQQIKPPPISSYYWKWKLDQSPLSDENYMAFRIKVDFFD